MANATPIKFNYIAHDTQTKSMKKWWSGTKLSSFNWKRNMDETNWSNDFYSDDLESLSYINKYSKTEW